MRLGCSKLPHHKNAIEIAMATEQTEDQHKKKCECICEQLTVIAKEENIFLNAFDALSKSLMFLLSTLAFSS